MRHRGGRRTQVDAQGGWARRRTIMRLAPALVLLAAIAGILIAAGSSAASTTCTIYWTGKTSNDWGTKANWSLTNNGSAAPRTPAATDFVCMSTAPATASVDLSSSTTATIDGINWPQAGSVNPSLEVDGTLTVGTKTAANPSSIQSLTVDGTLVSFKGEALTTPNLTLSGDIDGAGTVTASGPATLTGNASLGGGGTGAHLILQGAGSQTGNLSFDYGSELENAGTLTLSDTSDLYDNVESSNTTSQLVNDAAGTITYPGSNASQTANIQLDTTNAGTISVSKGTLDLADGNGPAGADTGTFTAASGATLDLGGTRTESSGATIAGAGTVEITGQTQFTKASNLTNTGTFEVDGDLSVASGINVTAANLDLTGDVDGPGTLTVSGPATLNGNGSLGAFGSGGHLILQGAGSQTGNFSFDYGSELENAGTLTLSDTSNLYDNVENNNTTSQLVNDAAGTIAYPGSNASQTANIQLDTTNAGTVSVSKGTLDLADGNGPAGADTGTFTAASGATLDLGGTRTESSGATIAGAGTVEITGQTQFTKASNLTNTGTFEVDGDLSVASGINVTAANLDLTGDVDGPGTLTVSGPATLNNGASLGGLGNGTHLTLQGATSQTGNLSFDYGSELENAGTLTLSDTSNLYDNVENNNTTSQLVNDAAGTITYPGSNASQTANIQLDTTNAGTVSVSVGTLDLPDGNGPAGADTGTFTAATGAALDLGGTRTEATGATIAGAGTVDLTGTATFTAASNLSNTGTLEISNELAIASGVNLTAANLDLVGDVDGPGTLTVSGPATLNNGASLGGLGNGTHLTLEGATSQTGNLSFDYGSELENAGTLTLSDTSNLYDNSENNNTTSQLVNDPAATITYTGSTASKSAAIGVQLTNNGTLIAGKGTLTISILTNLSSSGTLTGGTYESNGGTLSLPGSGITTNAATIVDGAGSITSGGSNALPGITSNSGTLDVQKALTLTGALTNTGTLIVEDASTLTLPRLTQSAGTTNVLSGSTLKATASGSNVVITGGKLTGTGAVTGSVSGAGTVSPIGAIAGPLTVSGTYSSVGGTLNIPISGSNTAGTDFGQISVGGVATLGGTLQIQTANGYTPPVGTTYTILKAGSVSGTFGSVTGTQISSGEGYSVSYTATSVVLTVTATSAPAPTVTNINPSSGPAAGGTSVTITGTGFSGATAVSFGNTAATSYTVNSATQITATSPAGSGTVDITVTTPGGTSSTSNADQFTYQAPPAPTVTNVAPSSGPAGGGTSVTITGTGFSNITAVSFGSTTAASYTVNSATQITATSPAGSGTVNVTVTSPSGTSATSATDQFTYQPAPTVSSVSPTSGPTAGGTTVTITGTSFTGATAVSFGSSTATTYTINSATQITASSPGGSGTVDITVTTASGTSPTSAADQFTYQVPSNTPTISGVSPSIGTPAGGTTVTITGMNFTSGATVDFGTVAAKVKSQTATQLVVTSPKHAAGTVDITVTTSAGTSPTSAADQYTFGTPPAPPTVTKVAPTSGTTAGGTTVTITGTGFTAGSTVQFGASAAAAVTYKSATTLTAVSPAQSAGVVDVTVTTANGTSTTSTKDHYTYTSPPAPTVTKVSPTSGTTAGGTTVTITGTGFTAGSTVQFGGTAAAKVTYKSATSLTAVSPAESSGTVDITVTTSGGTSATTSKDHFTFK